MAWHPQAKEKYDCYRTTRKDSQQPLLGETTTTTTV
jgi:hypothetical protein